MIRATFLSGAIPWILAAAPVAHAGDEIDAPLQSVMQDVNDALSAQGSPLRVWKAEYQTASTIHPGRYVIFEDRNFTQLLGGAHFVPGDPRRGGSNAITWANDLVDGATTSGVTAAESDAAIHRAMAAWQDVGCSHLPLVHAGSFEEDLGLVQNFLGFGGGSSVVADIVHAGWVPAAFFDELLDGGGSLIIGITFTFVLVDPETGAPTDINGSGTLDAGLREIYYNDGFSWAIDGRFDVRRFEGDIDVQSVATHEAGHGLGQGHFGALYYIWASDSLQFAPHAVMNPGYIDLIQDLQTTDVGGHCRIWATWPQH